MTDQFIGGFSFGFSAGIFVGACALAVFLDILDSRQTKKKERP